MASPTESMIEPLDLDTATDAEVQEIAQFRQELAASASLANGLTRVSSEPETPT